MTNFQRILPDKLNIVLDKNNVNGGYANVCGENGQIIVYRKEEWLKVLIHESLHSYGLEFSNLDLNKFNNKIKKLYPIQSNFNIFEAYTETWAEIINLSLIAYIFTNNIENYLKLVKYFIEIEREFSLLQMKKILNYYNLTYKDIINKENFYKENTNIFAYYIIKSILLWNINRFINWCYNNNLNYFNFNKNENTLNKFYNLIKDLYLNKELIKEINKNRIQINKSNIKFLNTNLRMTSIEI